MRSKKIIFVFTFIVFFVFLNLLNSQLSETDNYNDIVVFDIDSNFCYYYFYSISNNDTLLILSEVLDSSFSGKRIEIGDTLFNTKLIKRNQHILLLSDSIVREGKKIDTIFYRGHYPAWDSKHNLRVNLYKSECIKNRNYICSE